MVGARGPPSPDRPDPRQQPLEPADPDVPGSLARQPDDAYEAVGTVLSADEAEVVLDIGERQVVVTLVGYENPVPVGSPARARGPIIG